MGAPLKSITQMRGAMSKRSWQTGVTWKNHYSPIKN